MSTIKDKILELGGNNCVCGPTMMYGTGFPSEEKAQEFIDWMHLSYDVNHISAPLKMRHHPGYDVGYDVTAKS